MKTLFKLTLVVLAMLSLYACSAKAAAQPGSVILTEKDAGKTIEITNGDTFAIELEGNPSTGYNWEPESQELKHLKLVGEIEAKPASLDKMGAPQTIVLHFQAVSAGSETLMLVYHRSWEKGIDPLQTYEVTIVVK
jgi:predicted secreted protein